MTRPTFFRKPSDFRAWLGKYHRVEAELLVGFYRKDSGKPSITWPQSVDEALCFGWIDGIRRSIDELSYSIRFTPRKAKSHWSAININRVKELEKLGLMSEAGREAFSRRQKGKSARASYEQKNVRLHPSFSRQLEANSKALAFFRSRPPYYRKQCFWWIMSARKNETRIRRLNILIQSSEKGELIPPFRWGKR